MWSMEPLVDLVPSSSLPSERMDHQRHQPRTTTPPTSPALSSRLFLVAASTIHMLRSAAPSRTTASPATISLCPGELCGWHTHTAGLRIHGFTRSASAIMNVTGFNGRRAGGLPVGLSQWREQRLEHQLFPSWWQHGRRCGLYRCTLDSLQAQYSVDSTRVYACGFSAGGYMSHKLGCESPSASRPSPRYRHINTGDVGGCAPQHTPGVLQIHGTSDFIVSYNGSIFSGLGVQEVLDLWTSNLACATPPVVTPYNATVEQQVYAPCNGSASVVHYKIDGGGHPAPTGSTFSATDVIWMTSRTSPAATSAPRCRSFSTAACGMAEPSRGSALPARP